MKALTPLLTAGALAGAAALTVRRTSDDLRGEVAVVTGASRGLGLLLARELARQGCPLVICARDSAELDRAAGQLREAGADVTAVACDVTDEATPSRLVQAALERHGRLDIVISNAGIIQVGPVRAVPRNTSRPRWTPWRSRPPAWPWRRCQSCTVSVTAGSSSSPRSAAS